MTLDNTTTQMPSFTAPSVPAALEFALVVKDGTNPSRGDRVSGGGALVAQSHRGALVNIPWR